MSEDQAGIYFDEGSNAPTAYARLPAPIRALLRKYLISQQRTLGRSGPAGKQRKVLARNGYEWSPGYIVHWRLVLDPRQSVESVTHLSAYRIEVLHIETPE